MEASEVISRLKFLQNVRPGDKIDTTCVARQADDWCTPIIRYLRGENKTKTLEFLKKTIHYAFEIYEKYRDADQEHLNELSAVIVSDIQNAMVGISNLKRTYKADLKFVCDLTTICEHTQLKLKTLDGFTSRSKHHLNERSKSKKKDGRS